MLTQSELKELLSYDPATGVFVWRVARRGVKAGDEAGRNSGIGYRQITINGRYYLTHRLAWLYVHGVWPAEEVDHINGKRDDNRIENLRAVNRKQNGENQALQNKNQSGHRGVYWHKACGKWQASVRHHGKSYYLGLFDILEEAAAAAKQARDKLFTHHKTEHAA